MPAAKRTARTTKPTVPADNQTSELSQLVARVVDEKNESSRAELIRRLNAQVGHAIVAAVAEKTQELSESKPKVAEGWGGFKFSSGLYNLSPEATKNNVHDQLGMRLTQLNAMLALCYGEGAETVHELLGLNMKEEFFWAIHSLAQESKELANLL